MEAKICSKCGNPGEFFNDTRSKDGLQSQCKRCKSTGITSYYRTSKGKEYRKKHRRKWEKSYENKYPDKRREKGRKHYWENRISCNISRLLRRSLQGSKGGCHWETITGFTLKELEEHLEQQFKPGMNWKNYGQWHIDHIKPISSFNITSIYCEDFKECWSLKNLQPLWAEENFAKGNR